MSPKRIQAVYGSFTNTNMRNTLDHIGNFQRKQRPETAKINTKTMQKSSMQFLSTFEVGADGFKCEEKASMRYIPQSKLPSSKLKIRLKKDANPYTYQSNT